jgi:hypothetical protein
MHLDDITVATGTIHFPNEHTTIHKLQQTRNCAGSIITGLSYLHFIEFALIGKFIQKHAPVCMSKRNKINKTTPDYDFTNNSVKHYIDVPIKNTPQEEFCPKLVPSKVIPEIQCPSNKWCHNVFAETTTGVDSFKKW